MESTDIVNNDVGDRMLYDRVLGQELNEPEGKDPSVWRLLCDRNGYFYIFPALPTKDKTN